MSGNELRGIDGAHRFLQLARIDAELLETAREGLHQIVGPVGVLREQGGQPGDRHDDHDREQQQQPDHGEHQHQRAQPGRPSPSKHPRLHRADRDHDDQRQEDRADEPGGQVDAAEDQEPRRGTDDDDQGPGQDRPHEQGRRVRRVRRGLGPASVRVTRSAAGRPSAAAGRRPPQARPRQGRPRHAGRALTPDRPSQVSSCGDARSPTTNPAHPRKVGSPAWGEVSIGRGAEP